MIKMNGRTSLPEPLDFYSLWEDDVGDSGKKQTRLDFLLANPLDRTCWECRARSCWQSQIRLPRVKESSLRAPVTRCGMSKSGNAQTGSFAFGFTTQPLKGTLENTNRGIHTHTHSHTLFFLLLAITITNHNYFYYCYCYCHYYCFYYCYYQCYIINMILTIGCSNLSRGSAAVTQLNHWCFLLAASLVS